MMNVNPRLWGFSKDAGMAELADALDLGSSEATRTGSIPATRTKNSTIYSTVFSFHIDKML